VVFLYYTNENDHEGDRWNPGDQRKPRSRRFTNPRWEKMQVVLQANGIDSVHAF